MQISGKLLHHPVLHLVMIIGAGMLVYSNSLSGPFQLDEAGFLAGNPSVTNRGAATEALRGDVELYQASRLRTVGYLSFAMNYALHGLAVEGYHAVNIAIHLCSGLLLYALVVLTARSPRLIASRLREHAQPLGLAAALLFIVHPIQTEAVTYIQQRLTSLAAFFSLLALVLYAAARLGSAEAVAQAPGSGPAASRTPALLFLASLASIVLAMKTKENTFTLPLLIAAYEALFCAGSPRQRLRFLAPVLATLCIIPVTMLMVRQQTGATLGAMSGSTPGVSSIDYFLTQSMVLVAYLRLSLFPVGQRVLYDLPVARSLFQPEVLLSLGLLLALAGLAWLLYSRSRSGDAGLRIAAFGIAWFFISHAVESSFLPLPLVMCEYRMYLPLAGLILAVLTPLWLWLLRMRSGMAGMAGGTALALAVALLAGAAHGRNSLWNDRVLLWEDTVRKSPKSALAQIRLAVAYEKERRFEEAIERFREATRLDGSLIGPRVSLGILYDDLGRFGEAEREFLAAIALAPGHYDPHFELGVAYARQHRYDEAEREIRTALDLKPYRSEIHAGLGALCEMQGRVDEAERAYRAALGIDPRNAAALNGIGRLRRGQRL